MTELDPVRLGLVWRRLAGMVDEVAETFIRTSFSSVVRENHDLAFSLLDRNGRQFIQTRKSIPSFIGTLPATLRAMLDKFPLETLKPGDVLISNDPWLGTGHLNDISLAAPLFRNGRIVAFADSTAHTVDIGGAPSPTARDCYQEGLCIPVSKLVVAGEENQTILDFLNENLREPEETRGDIRAQLVAYREAEARLFQLMDDEGLEEIESVIDEILSRSEQSMRKVISDLPDGRYEDEMTVDGFDHPLTIRCSLIVRGDGITVDFEGTSGQIDRPVNCVLNYTRAYACYALKCALDPHAPNNDGSFQPITVTAPEASLLNAARPAPVWGRHLSGHYVPPAVFGALSKCAPDRIAAESGSPLWNVYFRGRDSRNDRRFVKMFFMNGGHGARAGSDGPGCLSFPSNVSNQSIEQFENQVPLLVTEKAFVADSGGDGTFRGGPSQRLSFLNIGEEPLLMTIRHERITYPPRGLQGGTNGAPGLDLVDGKPIPAKSETMVQPGQTVTFQPPGGGGIGEPKKRNPAHVKADVASGLLSPAKAKSVYGADL